MSKWLFLALLIIWLQETELQLPNPLLSKLPSSGAAYASTLDTQEVRLSFYYCLNNTPANPGDGGNYCTLRGRPLQVGDAACPPSWRGYRFVVVNDFRGPIVNTCEDTGGGLGSSQVDIWFYLSSDGWLWQEQMGTYGSIVWQ